MFTREKLDMLGTACLTAAMIARMNGNKEDADYFHKLAEECSVPRVWELIMDYYNCTEDKALELEPKVFELVKEGYGTQEAIRCINYLV